MPSTKKTSEATTAEKTIEAPAARKRGRPSTQENQAENAKEEQPKLSIKKDDKKEEDIVKDLGVSANDSATTDNNEPVVKRKRGRPIKKVTEGAKAKVDPSIPKRGRGRPKKTVSV